MHTGAVYLDCKAQSRPGKIEPVAPTTQQYWVLAYGIWISAPSNQL